MHIDVMTLVLIGEVVGSLVAVAILLIQWWRLRWPCLDPPNQALAEVLIDAEDGVDSRFVLHRVPGERYMLGIVGRARRGVRLSACIDGRTICW